MTRAAQKAPLASGETEFKVAPMVVGVAALVVALAGLFGRTLVEVLLPQMLSNWADETPWRWRGLVTTLSVGALVGSVGAAWRFNVIHWQSQLSWSLRGCAVAAALVMGSQAWPMLLVATGLSGLALGWLAVTLLTGLRPAVGTTSLGWVLGLGVAGACGLAGLGDWIGFSPRVQSILAAGLLAAASVLSPFLTPREPSLSAERDYEMASLGRWGLVTGGLIWGLVALAAIPETATMWVGAGAGFGVVVALLAGAATQRGVTMGLGLFVAILIGLGGGLNALGRQLAMGGGLAVWGVAGSYYAARGGRAWAIAILVGGSAGVGGASFLLVSERETISSQLIAISAAVVALIAIWQIGAKRRR